MDFYGYLTVENEWEIYKSHLADDSKPEDGAWRRQNEKPLSKLLFEIAKVLKFGISAIEIFEGGYAPAGWSHRDARYNGAVEFFNELREGKKTLPLSVHGVTPPPTANVPVVPALPQRDNQ